MEDQNMNQNQTDQYQIMNQNQNMNQDFNQELEEKKKPGKIKKTLIKIYRIISFVAIVLVISFVIFNAADMSQAIRDIGAMFGAGNLPLV